MKRSSVSRWLNCSALIITIVLSIVITYFLMQLDNIINGHSYGQLYYFGLQYDLAWWLPYSNLTKIIYACLGATMIFSASSLILGFIPQKKEEAKLITLTSQPQTVVNQEKADSPNVSCPHCHKTFAKPLLMLNFEGGKSRLVNVCPYCNNNLGDATKGSD